VLIEQAIFTSAVTERAQGYQIVCRSPGLSEVDATELAVWGPSHDSLLETAGKRTSVNFFRLHSGAYSVSLTAAAGVEYSGRGGKIYTHFLVVPPELLARFSNNPFALLRAARALGALEPRDNWAEPLEPLTLSGHNAPVDTTLLAQLARGPGPAAMATLVQAALASDRLAVASAIASDRLIAGLINLLPLECRPEFSFSTGLKCSPGRAVRISCLPDDTACWRATARCGSTLLDLNNVQLDEHMSWKGWAGCVAEILQSGKLSLLVAELEQSRPWLNCRNLHLLSNQVESDLEHGTRPSAPARSTGNETWGTSAVQSFGSYGLHERSDAAHGPIHASGSPSAAAVLRVVDQLAVLLAGQPTEIVELLERIDELVFSAINGDDRALVELEVLWPAVVDELDVYVIDQTREQYLRLVLALCSDCIGEEVRKPERAVAAIDVLGVLFEC
jgi:GTPase-associated protein 1, N-terminal domain type 2